MGLRRFGGPGMHGAGSVPLSSLGGGVHGGYAAKVLSTGPIAYWPLWETGGTTAQCLVNSAQNGTYVNVAVGSGTSLMGRPCPWWDGTGDCVNVYSATMAAAFNPSEGTLMVWCKVNSAAVWTDGVSRFILMIAGAAADDLTEFLKSSINTRMDWYYKAGGVLESNFINPITDVDWMQVAMTWSVSNDRVCYYRNGASAGACDNALGVWALPLAANLCAIGAQTNTGVSCFHGWISDTVIWDRELSLSEIQNLYTT